VKICQLSFWASVQMILTFKMFDFLWICCGRCFKIAESRNVENLKTPASCMRLFCESIKILSTFASCLRGFQRWSIFARCCLLWSCYLFASYS
jgi:hypothetical protein